MSSSRSCRTFFFFFWSLGIPNLPVNTSLMTPNLVLKMRPFAPPTIPPADVDYDQFHPSITASSPPPLSPLTLQRFAEAKANIQTHLESGKVVEPPGSDVTVLPLGTGGSLANKYRNGSFVLSPLSSSATTLISLVVGSSIVHSNPNSGVG